jgi:hypothetical protein
MLAPPLRADFVGLADPRQNRVIHLLPRDDPTCSRDA